MPCHPKALARLADRMAAAPREHVDHYLDQWLDYTQRATEWDADLWGFDPTRWMAAERAEMDRRAETAA